MKFIIGIDPGVKGGIAMLDQDGKVINVEKMPETPKDLYDHLVALMSHAASTASQMCEPDVVVYIESVEYPVKVLRLHSVSVRDAVILRWPFLH